MKRPTALLTIMLTILMSLLSWVDRASAELIDIIPGLYGGDGITLLLDPGFTPTHEAHFAFSSGQGNFNRLNKEISSEIGVFPFSSSVGGFTFTFDAARGDFVRTTKSLGPLFSESAPTLGGGKNSVKLSYTYFTYNEFNGQNLGSFEEIILHPADPVTGERTGFRADTVSVNLDLNIDVRVLALSATYGITDDLDFGFLVPLVAVDMSVRSFAVVNRNFTDASGNNPHFFESGPEKSPFDSGSGDASGLGDVVLRTKYHILKTDSVDMAGAFLAKLATGDEKDFLGTGSTTLRPFFVMNWTGFGSTTPHLNLGYEFNLDRSNQSSVEYVVGLDTGSRSFTLGAEIIGSHELRGDGIGDDIVTGSVGVKFNPHKRLIVSANIQIPLNEGGLRSQFIPTLGIENNF